MASGDPFTTLKVNPKGNDAVTIRRNFSIQQRLINNVSSGIGPSANDNIVWFGTATPATDGVTRDFTTAFKYVTGTLRVMRDQSTLLEGIDFTETDENNFNLTLAPDADEALRVGYVKKGIQ